MSSMLLGDPRLRMLDPMDHQKLDFQELIK
jgi:hypothetical protein